MRPLLLEMEAFGSYADKTTIDFTRPMENLFLVTGNTGSGKSTIFDGICFALYGESSGSDTKDGVEFQSQYASIDVVPKVKFIFEDKNEKYTVIRVPKHIRKVKRKTKDGSLTKEENGTVELIIGEDTPYNEKDVQNRINSIIGFTKQEFTRIAMIAQGEFMELLRAKTKDKQQIFRKLFHTEIYQKIAEELNSRNKEINKQIAILKTECNTEIAHIEPFFTEETNEGNIADYEELTASFEKSLVRMDELLEFISNICSEQKQQLKKTSDSYTKLKDQIKNAREILAKSETIAKAYESREKSENILKEIEQKKAEITQLENKLKITNISFEIKPYYDEMTGSLGRIENTNKTISQIQKELPQLEENERLQLQEMQERKLLSDKETETYLSTKAKIEAQLDNYDKKIQIFYERMETLRAKEKQLTSFGEKYLATVRQYEEASKEYEKLNRKFLDNQAGIIAASLEEGKPCPVCGSVSHPNIYKNNASDIVTEIMVKEALTLKDKCNKAQSDCSISLNSLKKDADNIQLGLNEISLEIFNIPYEDTQEYYEKIENIKISYDKKRNEIKEMEVYCKDLKRQYEMFNAQYEKTKEQVTKNKSALKSLNEQVLKEQEIYQQKKEAYESIIKEKNITTEQILLYTAGTTIEQVRRQEEDIRRLKQKEMDAHTTIRNADDLIKDCEKPDIDRLNSDVIQLENEAAIIEKEKNNLQYRLENNKKVKENLDKLNKKHEKLYNKHICINRLSNIASGKVQGQNKVDLETYVQRYYLDKVLQAANRRFTSMSSGQFELTMKREHEFGGQSNTGLDLVVHSLVTDSYRDVKTLSGGESFMAALSMALGMADIIQSMKGAISLDMMFIDEGFGSLDDESRNQAVYILKELAGGNRLIGIISHVSELKNQIDDRLEVSKDGNGSCVRWA